MRTLVDSLRQLWSDPRGWLRGHREGGLRLLRVSTAAALAWFIAERTLSDTTPVLAPLTALLTVQVTLYRTMATAVQRAAGVTVGVLLALAVAHFLGLHTWTIGLVTAVALMIGALFRLRSQAEEIAISAMLVLAVGYDPRYAQARVVETILGAGVGIAASLLVPSVYVRSADRSLASLAASAATLVTDMGLGLTAVWNDAYAQDWLARARQLGQLAAGSREALGRAEESLRYNPRRHHAPGSLDHLHEGKTGLEHVTQQIRTVARTLADVIDGDPDEAARHAGLRSHFGEFLTAYGGALRAYGEALDNPLAGGAVERTGRLRQALAVAQARYDGAAVAMRVDPEEDPLGWSVNGSLLSATARMLREIDPDQGLHVQALRPAPPPPTVLRALKPPAQAVLRPVRRLRPRDALRRGDHEADDPPPEPPDDA